jgi:ribosomal protein S21
MTRPANVQVDFDGSTRSVDQLIRKFIRKCKDEGIIQEHLDQFVHETKGQKNRRKRREARRRHQKRQLTRKSD